MLLVRALGVGCTCCFVFGGVDRWFIVSRIPAPSRGTGSGLPPLCKMHCHCYMKAHLIRWNVATSLRKSTSAVLAFTGELWGQAVVFKGYELEDGTLVTIQGEAPPQIELPPTQEDVDKAEAAVQQQAELVRSLKEGKGLTNKVRRGQEVGGMRERTPRGGKADETAA